MLVLLAYKMKMKKFEKGTSLLFTSLELNPLPLVSLLYPLKKTTTLNSPVEKKFQVTFQGRDSVEQMQHVVGR